MATQQTLSNLPLLVERQTPNGIVSPRTSDPATLPATNQEVEDHDRGVFLPLPEDTFDIIYADPPWDYKGQLQHAGPGSRDTGGAVRHYPTVRLEDLKRLPVWDVAAKDCLLFMWATSPHLDQAIDLGKTWGFSWATIAFVWDKVRVNPGFYTLSQYELCLVFKKGKIPTPRGARNVRQSVVAQRKAHSAKPDEVRRRIDRMFPQTKKIELFARQELNGTWTAWGLQTSEATTFYS